MRKFQFQTGSIKSSSVANSVSVVGGRFNSKLVRLKVNHYPVLMNELLGFNSKLVRLKVAWMMKFGEFITVSIPNWFD